MIDWAQWASAIGGLATAVGVGLAAWQVRASKGIAQGAFEDSLVKEYRELVHQLPTDALMGLSLTEEAHGRAFDDFYRYFDLSNEQVFLQSRGRVTKETWEMWSSGIESNMRRRAFKRAWDEVSQRTKNGDFSELRSFLETRGIRAALALPDPSTDAPSLHGEPQSSVERPVATR